MTRGRVLNCFTDKRRSVVECPGDRADAPGEQQKKPSHSNQRTTSITTPNIRLKPGEVTTVVLAKEESDVRIQRSTGLFLRECIGQIERQDSSRFCDKDLAAKILLVQHLIVDCK